MAFLKFHMNLRWFQHSSVYKAMWQYSLNTDILFLPLIKQVIKAYFIPVLSHTNIMILGIQNFSVPQFPYF